ncbi:RES domain-containing protein [Solirubrobacter sp. CPCC 204708]|nr:RES domain-containing protein [Solirubrobacter deserti]
MTPLADPPARLPADPPEWTWPADRPFVRIYHEHPLRDGMAPRTYGPLNRFDPHVRDRRQQPREDPHGRGVLYLAHDLGTALAEAFQGQWPAVSICPHARAGWVRPTRAIRLLDLTGNGAMAIGAVGTVATGDEPRRRTQRWGRRIYEQYTHLAGIRYPGAHQGGESIALWDRAPALERLSGGDRRLRAVWTRVAVALADQRRYPRRIDAAECAACTAAGYDL